MAMTNAGFNGTVDEAQFSRMMAIGSGEGVDSTAAWAVTQGTGRQVSVAAQNGWAFAAGVVSRETVALALTVPTPTQGAWHVVVRNINWSTDTVTIALRAGATLGSITPPAFPPATLPGTVVRNPGVSYDQPLAWAFVNSANTTLTIFDLRDQSLDSRLELMEKTPMGRVLRANVARTIPATTWTPLTTAAEWTTTGGVAPANGVNAFDGTWVAPKAGIYAVGAQVTFNATINMFLAVKRNSTSLDSTNAALLTTAAGTSALTAANAAGDITLAAGDVLRLYVFLSTSAAWNVSADLSFFGIRYVGPAA